MITLLTVSLSLEVHVDLIPTNSYHCTKFVIYEKKKKNHILIILSLLSSVVDL